MKYKSLKLPVVMIAVGLVLALVACLLTGIVKEPTITRQDFNFSVTYQLDGETKTIEGVYRSQFVSTGKGIDPLERYYSGQHVSETDEVHPGSYTIARKDGLELCVVTSFNDAYLMGEPDSANDYYDPYIAVYDDMGVEYADEETLSMFYAKIIDWDYPRPVANSFRFAGFSILHEGSMAAMLAVGLLTVVACMFFVKRDEAFSYNGLDRAGIALNCLITLVLLPVFALIVVLMQLYVGGDEFIYQVDLCTPAITAFAVAASIVLRRKGFRKSGFFVQFVGPVLFFLLGLLEVVL